MGHVSIVGAVGGVLPRPLGMPAKDLSAPRILRAKGCAHRSLFRLPNGSKYENNPKVGAWCMQIVHTLELGSYTPYIYICIHIGRHVHPSCGSTIPDIDGSEAKGN